MVGRIPQNIEGYGPVRPFSGAYAKTETVTRASVHVHGARPGAAKVLPSIAAAIEACELSDGATISFHHHLRNGDDVLRAVMAEIAARGLKDIKVAATSLFPVHVPLVEHIRNDVVTGIATAYMAGPVAEAVSKGWLPRPAVMQTHGGRARAIESGDLHIDVAFVAAPTADECGNLNGVYGKSACGTMGYPMVDVKYADRVVAITDNLVPYPACPIDITQQDVDFVVQVDSIGDPQQIASGILRVTTKPDGLQMAAAAAEVISASGLLKDGFSFQAGGGGVSLAVASFLKDLMSRKGIVGSFASGGITGRIVDMFQAGLFRTLLDVQCFDLEAVASYRQHTAHQSMSASMYANPHTKGAVVDQLDAVILGAAEVDLDFHTNVTLGSDGRIIGGSGGHSDTAAGAKLALVTTQLAYRNYPKIVDRVASITTPGETIDAVITEEGIAVNPRRPELRERLLSAGMSLCTIDELRDRSKRSAGDPPKDPPARSGRIVAVTEYRDGTVIDVVEGHDHSRE